MKKCLTRFLVLFFVVFFASTSVRAEFTSEWAAKMSSLRLKTSYVAVTANEFGHIKSDVEEALLFVDHHILTEPKNLVSDAAYAGFDWMNSVVFSLRSCLEQLTVFLSVGFIPEKSYESEGSESSKLVASSSSSSFDLSATWALFVKVEAEIIRQLGLVGIQVVPTVSKVVGPSKDTSTLSLDVTHAETHASSASGVKSFWEAIARLTVLQKEIAPLLAIIEEADLSTIATIVKARCKSKSGVAKAQISEIDAILALVDEIVAAEEALAK